MYYIIYAIPSLYIKVYIFDLLSYLVFIHFFPGWVVPHPKPVPSAILGELRGNTLQYIKILQL